MIFETIKNNPFLSYRRIRPNPRCEVKSGVRLVNSLILDWKDLLSNVLTNFMPEKYSLHDDVSLCLSSHRSFYWLLTTSCFARIPSISLHRSATTSLDLSPWSIPLYKSVPSQKSKVHKGARQQNKSAPKMQLGVTFRFSCRKGQRLTTGIQERLQQSKSYYFVLAKWTWKGVLILTGETR